MTVDSVLMTVEKGLIAHSFENEFTVLKLQSHDLAFWIALIFTLKILSRAVSRLLESCILGQM